MIKWTFVRINYHYMGLPFLCMRGSLRITGRLLHIFFSNPLHQICLYLFHSAVFGKALSLRWPQALSKTSFPQSMCMRIFFPRYYRHWRIIIFLSFFFLQKKKATYSWCSQIPSRLACCCMFLMSICLVQHTINIFSEIHWMRGHLPRTL